MKNCNPMVDALRKHKGQGIDINIMLGGSPDSDQRDEEQKELGFAPDGTDVSKSEDEMEMADAGLMKPLQEMPGEEDIADVGEEVSPEESFFQTEMKKNVGSHSMGPLAKAAMAFNAKKKGLVK